MGTRGNVDAAPGIADPATMDPRSAGYVKDEYDKPELDFGLIGDLDGSSSAYMGPDGFSGMDQEFGALKPEYGLKPDYTMKQDSYGLKQEPDSMPHGNRALFSMNDDYNNINMASLAAGNGLNSGNTNNNNNVNNVSGGINMNALHLNHNSHNNHNINVQNGNHNGSGLHGRSPNAGNGTVSGMATGMNMSQMSMGMNGMSPSLGMVHPGMVSSGFSGQMLDPLALSGHNGSFMTPEDVTGLSGSAGDPTVVRPNVGNEYEAPFSVDLAMVRRTMEGVNRALGVDLGGIEVGESSLLSQPHGDEGGEEEEAKDGASKAEMSHVRLISDACGHIVASVGRAVLEAAAESHKENVQQGHPELPPKPPIRKKRGGILGFKELATRANLSPWHFHRVFRFVTGVTPKAYGEALWEYLMIESGFDLANEELTISKAATSYVGPAPQPPTTDSSNPTSSSSSSSPQSPTLAGKGKTYPNQPGANPAISANQNGPNAGGPVGNQGNSLSTSNGGLTPGVGDVETASSVSSSTKSPLSGSVVPSSGAPGTMPPLAGPVAPGRVRKSSSRSRGARSRSRNRSQSQHQVLNALSAEAGSSEPQAQVRRGRSYSRVAQRPTIVMDQALQGAFPQPMGTLSPQRTQHSPQQGPQQLHGMPQQHQMQSSLHQPSQSSSHFSHPSQQQQHQQQQLKQLQQQQRSQQHSSSAVDDYGSNDGYHNARGGFVGHQMGPDVPDMNGLSLQNPGQHADMRQMQNHLSPGFEGASFDAQSYDQSGYDASSNFDNTGFDTSNFGFDHRSGENGAGTGNLASGSGYDQSGYDGQNYAGNMPPNSYMRGTNVYGRGGPEEAYDCAGDNFEYPTDAYGSTKMPMRSATPRGVSTGPGGAPTRASMHTRNALSEHALPDPQSFMASSLYNGRNSGKNNSPHSIHTHSASMNTPHSSAGTHTNTAAGTSAGNGIGSNNINSGFSKLEPSRSSPALNKFNDKNGAPLFRQTSVHANYGTSGNSQMAAGPSGSTGPNSAGVPESFDNYFQDTNLQWDSFDHPGLPSAQSHASGSHGAAGAYDVPHGKPSDQLSDLPASFYLGMKDLQEYDDESKSGIDVMPSAFIGDDDPPLMPSWNDNGAYGADQYTY